MKCLRISIYIIFLMLSGYFSGYAQEELHFEHISVETGLSNSVITHIHQDQYGYMWFATRHGLNRFDGFSFKVYRYDPDDSLSISSNLIYQIFEDPKGDLWLSLGIGGICKFDRARERFSYYAYDKSQPLHPNNSIVNVVSHPGIGTWVATHAGLNYIDEETQTFELRFSFPQKSSNDPPAQIVQLYLDNTLKLWLGTNKGMFEYDIQSNSILKAKHINKGIIRPFKEPIKFIYEDKDGRIWAGIERQIFYWDQEEELFVAHGSTFKNSHIRMMFGDAFGRIWVATENSGLFFLESIESNFKSVPTSQNMPKNIYHAFADANGGIWAMDINYELFYLAPGRINAQKMKLTPTGSVPYKLNNITAHYSSPDGSVWVGTNGAGVFKLNPGRHKFRHYKNLAKPANIEPSNNITSICEDLDGFIWLGTKSGLQRFDPKNRSFKVWEYPPDNSYNIKFNEITALLVDHLNFLWIATPNGISIFDPLRENQQIFPIYETQDLSFVHPAIYQIYEDSKHNIWICTSDGLILWNRKKKQLQGFQGGQNSFPSNTFYAIIEGKNGDYWIGNKLGGLNRLRFKNDQPVIDSYFFEDQFRPWLKARTVNTVFEAQSGELWVGTYSQGLLKVDTLNKRLVSAKKNGEPPIPNIVSIMEDTTQKLWICSNDGLFKYDPDNNTFKQFDFNDGLQSNQFNLHAALKSTDGQMYIGGVNGFNVFDPQSIRLARKISSPILTGINIRGKSTVFEQPLHQIEHIDLGSNENFFSLEFISLNYRNSRPNQYAFQLEGIDPEWVYAGTQRIATYTNVPSGTYTFQVKAATGDGYWNPNITQIQIHIHKPFWQTSWFYALLALIALSLMGLFQHIRLHTKLRNIQEIESIRQKAMEDFHDEMGHRLTRISLLAEMLNSPRVINPAEHLDTIKTSAHRLHESMRDFLWALDPKQDSLFEFALMLKDFGDELYDKTGVDFRIEGIHPNLDHWELSMDWKRHLSLIFKEAMNNVLKHASASNVLLKFSLVEKYLTVSLVDNGTGFVPNAQKAGYGLGNMHKRAQKLGGQLIVESQPNSGTIVTFSNQLPTGL